MSLNSAHLRVSGDRLLPDPPAGGSAARVRSLAGGGEPETL